MRNASGFVTHDTHAEAMALATTLTSRWGGAYVVYRDPDGKRWGIARENHTATDAPSGALLVDWVALCRCDRCMNHGATEVTVSRIADEGDLA